MTIYKDYRVEIPNKTFISSKGYVQVYTKFYRNKDGKPRNKSLVIGKPVDDDKKLMFPNDNYFEYFHIDRSSLTPIFEDNIKSKNDTIDVVHETSSVGATALVHKTMKDTGLLDVMSDTFDDDTVSSIETVVSLMLIDGSVMADIDLFMDSHYCYNMDHLLNSQRTSDLFKSINIDLQDDFFRNWIAHNGKDDTFAYDVTSISTYSKGIIDAEYGYNRDKEKLPQVNLGMFSSSKTRMPIYCIGYNGSLPDKTNLPNVLKKAEDMGITSTRLCMDGGFCTEDNFKFINGMGDDDHKIKFIMGVPGNLNVSQELFSEFENKIDNISNRTRFQSNYIVSKEKEVYGIKGNMVVGINTKTREMMMNTLIEDIDKRSKELKENQKSSKYETVISKSRYKKLFKISKGEGENNYSFETDEEEIDKISRYYGYFCIFTNDMSIDKHEVLYEYRRKDIDEKVFYALKNYLNIKRLRTHNKETTQGKLFIAFIALIVRTAIFEKLKELPKNYTVKRTLKILENIMVTSSGNDKYFSNALTKEQKEMLKAFGITEKELL